MRAEEGVVIVRCDEEMDRAGLEEWVWIEHAAGERVESVTSVSGREIRFRPARAFAPGTYGVRADERLEDLAGNSFKGLFESRAGEAAPPSGATRRSFTIP